MITGKNYIGNTLSNTGDKTFSTFNPILNEENEWVFYEASHSELTKAISLATEAFKTYKAKSGKEKAKFLNTIADEIEALGDDLLTVYCKESGLPEGRARGERGRTLGQLRSFAQLIEDGSWVNATIAVGLPDREPMPRPDLRKMMVPLGPVAVFGASNFPLAFSTAGGDTASALAAGCPVVVKSHPMHAGTGEMIASAVCKAVEKTGMPDGVFSNLNSSGIEIGQNLANHPMIKAIGFTGSHIGGRALFDIAAKREIPIPVFAEMGSVNPVVISPGAVKSKGEDWARTYAGSITLAAGQFCTNPGLLFAIDSAELEEFIEVLSTEISKVDPFCMLGTRIKANYSDRKSQMIAHEAVTVKRTVNAMDNYGDQAIVTVDGATFSSDRSLQEEVFGPFSMIVKCRDLKELALAISSLDGQLTGTVIFEEDEISDFESVIATLQDKVGRLIYNGVPTGVEVNPAMQHGGPYPASTDSRFGAVGNQAIYRWVRPLSFQDWPDQMLPEELKNKNELDISRFVDNQWTKASL